MTRKQRFIDSFVASFAATELFDRLEFNRQYSANPLDIESHLGELEDPLFVAELAWVAYTKNSDFNEE